MRRLPPTLKTWFDSMLLNPTPVEFTPPLDPRIMLVLTAKACVGITEIGADNCGAMVELFQNTVPVAKGSPWCMSFIQSCVAYVESYGFKSPLFSTAHCLTAWVNSKCMHPLEPTPGDIVIYRFDSSSAGHTELITGVHPEILDTIGGNTGNGVDIEREGDGVYSRRRQRGGAGRMRELGYLRVFEAPAPK
jgi:hypothetical protein